ncbi:MAG: hypothetical protein LBK12_07295 [Odoribacteraceae bacterium]|jgi:hypothetical protein|nr:hypothetical protein [Odoribacteraceae bacterium]
MYKFKRRVFAGHRSMEFWFGLTSKSRDHHFNFTLYLLTEGPGATLDHAERLRSGIHSKGEAERFAVQYAGELLRALLEREKGWEQQSDVITEPTDE